MPRGIPNRPDYVIDLELEEPARSSPALGQLDRMLKQSLVETQSLHVVRRMMLREMIDRAKVTGVSKFTAATRIREEHRAELPPAHTNGYGKPVRKKRDRVARKTEFAKANICGPRLTLFILEHISEGNYTTGDQILKMLKETGKANHIDRLSGVYGMLTREGFMKRNGEDRSYRLLTPGKRFMTKLRTTLEAKGECIPGQYIAPAAFTGTHAKLGFKTMKRHFANRKAKAVKAS